MSRLTLLKGHDRRLRSGHPWVFSNELAPAEVKPAPGASVELYSHGGEFLGLGTYNPHSLIALRLLSRRREAIDSVEFYRQRIAQAWEQRSRRYGSDQAVRVVYGEADGLPGLVVDRYGEVLSLQLLTLGMDQRRELIVAALQELFAPAAIVARNDVAVRELEGLSQQVELLCGTLPETLIVGENQLRFAVDVLGGQKTGQFLDQKENHLALRGRVEGGRVLDLFCYSGSWALHAGHFGAREVLGVDISAPAVELAQANARLNGLEGICRFIRADVFDLLRDLARQGEQFDTVVLDPPAFVKSRKKLPEAIKGYLTINRRALELVAPGGYLFTCTCSHHLDRDTFLDLLRQAGQQSGRTLILEELRGQAFDHPVLLACPETDYLKCAILKVL
jgi:23S rRNA (cytosine1962-C5)-methyltransferase